MKTKKINWLSKLAVTLVLGFISLHANAANWDMTIIQPNSSYIAKNVQWFSDQVKNETDGEINITVHPNGSLYSGKQTLRAVQRNQAQLGVRVLSAYQNQEPFFGADSVPFLADTFKESDVLWDFSKPIINKKLSRKNVIVLYSIPWPPQGLFFSKKINSPDDMQGIKFRAYNNSTAKVAQLLGMSATIIPEEELSQAAATGMVESLISSGEPVFNHQLWNYLPYFYDVKAWLVRAHVMINKSEWDSLDRGTQKTIKQIAKKAAARGEEAAKVLSHDLKKDLAAKGVSINQPPKWMQEEMAAIGQEMQKAWMQSLDAKSKHAVHKYLSTVGKENGS